MPSLVYTRLPRRPKARHVRLIECLLNMNRAGHRDAVWQCIKLCQDVRQHGHQSRYVVSLKGFLGFASSSLPPEQENAAARESISSGFPMVALYW